LISITAHQEQRKKLTKNEKLKRELLTVPPRQRCQNFDWVQTCIQKIQNFRT